MEGDKPMVWVAEETTPIFDARIFSLVRQHSKTEDGRKEADFFLLQSKDWVNVVAITREQQVVLVEQFRHGTGHLSLETPGGILNKDETMVDAALRELREETGYSGRARVLGSADANSAFMTNRFAVVLVEEAVCSEATAFDEHEDLRVRLVPVAELPKLVQAGAVQNTHALLALCWYLLGYGPQSTV
ncbi:MAG: NUDIX hydrolase [Herpetosiphon sp.]